MRATEQIRRCGQSIWLDLLAAAFLPMPLLRSIEYPCAREKC